jgi:SAM-dependent methyltransferase
MTKQSSLKCRLCLAPLSGKPEVELRHVPRGAQYFPTAEQRESDYAVDLDIHQCDYCGLIQLAGDAVIYGEGETSATAFSPAMRDHRAEQMRAFVDQFQLRGKKVIDIGCGDGHLVKILSDAGVEAAGIEPSRKARAIGEQTGLKIIEGFATASEEIEGSPYDGFTSVHSLEHAPDPNDYLRGVYGALRPGAAGLVEVPSVEQAIERSRFYDFLADHLSYFSAETLRFALEKNGFEVVQVERNWSGEHLVALAKKRESTEFGILQDHATQLPIDFQEFVSSQTTGGRRVALWGASHHAITMLAMRKSNGVEYVVDSADYKQGRFTPVSHLPIVGPEKLRSNPVDVVIVFAPRYNDEIVGQLKHELQFKGTIALLRGSHLEVIQ